MVENTELGQVRVNFVFDDANTDLPKDNLKHFTDKNISISL